MTGPSDAYIYVVTKIMITIKLIKNEKDSLIYNAFSNRYYNHCPKQVSAAYFKEKRL